jgi:GNAT superfamily N-acetyltransferase
LRDKPKLSAVEPLNDEPDIGEFECGKHQSLTDWLKRYAKASEQARSARTYVIHRANRVVGYFSLTASSVRKVDASPRAAKGQPGYPIPVILLARLAIDKSEQGQGLGAALLKDALQRCLRASEEIGARAVLVHAIDEEAKSFYQHFGFENCTVDDLHLMLLIKDIPSEEA